MATTTIIKLHHRRRVPWLLEPPGTYEWDLVCDAIQEAVTAALDVAAVGEPEERVALAKQALQDVLGVVGPRLWTP